ncbi:MAG: hypothetical protein IJ515_03300 [Clostridia bacterium]|nr:hypothetical protein [Clostridia bacterium]
MDWKKLGKALLFPHIAIMLVLIPLSAALVVCSMLFVGTDSVIACISYALAAYTLTVWCIKIPYLIQFFKRLKTENEYVKRWFSDERLRVNVSLYSSLAFNVAYAIFQLGLGFYHSSFWFYSLAGYYISLAIMRFFLVRHTSTHRPGEKMDTELVRYRTCGWIFLVMNLAIAMMIFFMVYWDKTFVHHEITTIAMAAYTFTAFTISIVNIVKYSKYKSPVYSASKEISLAAACVSMLTLESTMLTTFGTGADIEFRRIMLSVTGAIISAFIIIMAIYMIVHSNKSLKSRKMTTKDYIQVEFTEKINGK